MKERIFIIFLIVALIPLFYWLGKSVAYLTLCKLFGMNVTYKEKVNGVLVTKKVRIKND